MSFKRHIPNFLTVCNLICGCAAIFLSFQFQFVDALLFILVAAMFDFFDGMVARLLKVNSEIGKELDSMADMVSFGITPFFLVTLFLFQLSELHSVTLFFKENLWLISLVLTPSLSAIRLARFNLDSRQNDGFIGLNTPTNTLFLISLPFICQKLNFDFQQASIFIVSLATLSALLLNANIPMLNFKFKTLSLKDNFLRYSLIAISVIVFISCLMMNFIAISFPIIILLYLLISFIEQKTTHEI